MISSSICSNILLIFAVTLLIWENSLVDAQASVSRFTTVKHQSMQNSIVNMDGNTFQEHASGKHNYSMIILFSTNEKRVQCVYCSQVNDNFKVVANYYRSHIGADSKDTGAGYDSAKFYQNPVIFVYVDVTTAREFVQQAKWQELPKIIYVPPRAAKGNNMQLEDFQGLLEDFSSERIGSWVSEKVKDPQFKVPASLINLILMYAAGIVVIYLVATRVIPNFMNQYKKPRFWLIMSLGAYAFAMAGTVFNSINHPPWYYKHPSGQTFWIYPQQRQQFIGEGLIMAALLTLCAVLFTSFGAIVPTFKGPWLKRGMCMVILLSFYMVYDAIFRIFKMKVNWYPF